MVASIALYDIVVALHVIAVIGSFGVLVAWPWLPSGTAAAHAARARIVAVVISRGAVVVLATGIYLATDAKVWSKVWVSVPLLVIVVVLGLAGAYLTPKERELAARGGDAELNGRVVRAALVAAVLVALAAFLMVTKPGG